MSESTFLMAGAITLLVLVICGIIGVKIFLSFFDIEEDMEEESKAIDAERFYKAFKK